jgi:hypothetical protein
MKYTRWRKKSTIDVSVFNISYISSNPFGSLTLFIIASRNEWHYIINILNFRCCKVPYRWVGLIVQGSKLPSALKNVLISFKLNLISIVQTEFLP